MHLNAEFHRRARKDRKGFFNEKLKEIEEDNRKEKTRDLFSETGDRKVNISRKDGHSKGQKW